MEQVHINLTKIQDWCNANKVTVNQKKTNYMIIKSRQRQIEVKGTLRMSGTDISEVSTASFV